MAANVRSIRVDTATCRREKCTMFGKPHKMYLRFSDFHKRYKLYTYCLLCIIYMRKTADCSFWRRMVYEMAATGGIFF